MDEDLSKLLDKIVIEQSPSGSFFAFIPEIKGISAYAPSKEQCLTEFRDVLKDWIKLKNDQL